MPLMVIVLSVSGECFESDEDEERGRDLHLGIASF